MTKTKLHRLSDKYPNVDIAKRGWAKKKYIGKGWHWKITKKGEKALMRRKKK